MLSAAAVRSLRPASTVVQRGLAVGATPGGASRWARSLSTGPNVGVIGAGQIGRAVTVALRKRGHEVRVHDPSTRNRAELEGIGATWAESPREAVETAEVRITALPAAPHIRSVMEGVPLPSGAIGSTATEADDARVAAGGASYTGLLDELPSTGVRAWIDHTTTDHHEVRRLAARAEAAGVTLLEAPLTGGLELLKGNMMTVLVGGTGEAMAAHEGLMRAYAATVLHMGPVGAASIVKVVTNQLAAVHLVAAAEAMAICKSHGIGMEAAFDGIRASAGNSYVLETEVPLMFNGTFDPGFAIELHCKDLNMGREIAMEGGVPLELMTLSEQLYRRAMHRYGKEVGSSHPARMYQDDTGHALQVRGWDDWSYKITPVPGGGLGVVHLNRPEPGKP